MWKSIFDDIFWLGKSDGFGYMAYAAHRDAEISGEVRRLQTIFCAKWQNFVSCFSRLGERCIGVAYKEI